MLYSEIMGKLPKNYEEKIGEKQTIARSLTMDGIDIVVRIQKPFEEEDYELTDLKKDGLTPFKVIADSKGKARLEPVPEDYYIVWGTAFIVETWCAATKTVITADFQRGTDQTEEEFAFIVRYMLNNGSDEEIIDLIRSRGIDTQIKIQTSKAKQEPELPLPPKRKQLKKKN